MPLRSSAGIFVRPMLAPGRRLRSVRQALSGAGYVPVVTGDPEEALVLLNEQRPELALLDLVLPGSDGIELMKKITESQDIPIVFISAYGHEDTIARALDNGAADYLVKPFSPTELAARVRAVLRTRTSHRTVVPSDRNGHGSHDRCS